MEHMRFAIGTEIDSQIDEETARHMLAYNIPIEKINEVQIWLEKNTNKDLGSAGQLKQLQIFHDTADRLNIPYNKDVTVKRDVTKRMRIKSITNAKKITEMIRMTKMKKMKEIKNIRRNSYIYGGMAFAVAVKNEFDDMLADILVKGEENPVGYIFNRLVESNSEIQLKMNQYEDLKEAYKAIFNDEEILKSVPQIGLIKQLYYQIIDLRLFANQRVGNKAQSSIAQEIQDLESMMLEEIRKKNIGNIDNETINLINAELYSRLFEKDSSFYTVSTHLSEIKGKEMLATEKYKEIKLALYYSIACQISEYIKNDKVIREDLLSIQNALITSEISFADIFERNNWFNSELVRRGKTPFSFNTAIFKPKLQDVIQIMHQVGGIVVAAHPWVYANESCTIDEYLNNCKNRGVDGVEAFYTETSDLQKYQEQMEKVKKFCIENNLIYGTGGTDYHSKTTEKIGVLRSGERILLDELGIKTTPANVFMQEMAKVMDKIKTDEGR